MSTMREAKDGMLYWTLSFYMSRAQIEGSKLDLSDFEDTVEAFVHDTEPPAIPTKFLDLERRKAIETPALDATSRTARLRGAINPLFNDIADRSRLGRVEDFLFAAGEDEPEELAFVLPDRVEWTTEGRTYHVPTDPDDRHFPAQVDRFWYLHGNGAMSWHVNFAVQYRDGPPSEAAKSRFNRSLEGGNTPGALYLLSLIQKLAYPKELKLPEGAVNPRSDDVIGLKLSLSTGRQAKFWDRMKFWFINDAGLIKTLNGKAKSIDFEALCPVAKVNEVPGLVCHDTRSQIFIHDREFFELIQPKGVNGELVERRAKVLEPEFNHYPGLVGKEAKSGEEPGALILDEDYWRALRTEIPTDTASPTTAARERQLYLFLAGFNQNIIDWTNQEASEVLDSLDPIYPQSDEQLEEGFFIRYANPRVLITYVQRSRTLEVGNDYIGTCPYAFLIHALSMHNERLSRDQEKLAFAVVEKVNVLVREAAKRPNPNSEREKLDSGFQYNDIQIAEMWINWYRMAAFEVFARHRYANPFRYDTERDVFAELEKLRGISRLEGVIDKAFAALEESARDLERVRAEKERDAEREADGKKQDNDRRTSVFFGLVGFSGVGQLAFNWYTYLTKDRPAVFAWGDFVLISVQVLIPLIFVGFVLRLFWPRRRN